MYSAIDKVISRSENIKPLYIAIAIFCANFILAMIDFGNTNICCDMAEYLNNPVRILQGDMPYADFWLLFPPGEVYFPALIYKLFGINTDILRLVTIISSTLIPVASFYLGRLIFRRNSVAVVLSFLVYYTSVAYQYEGPEYLHLFFLMLLISAYYLIKYIYHGSSYLLLVSGIFSGLALTFRLYESAGAIAGFLLALIIYQLLTDKFKMRNSLKVISLFSAGLLIVMSAFFAIFHEIAGKMINELIFESVKNGTSMNLPYFHQFNLILNSIYNDINLLSEGIGLSKLVYLAYHILKLPLALLYYILPILSIYYMIQFLRSGAGTKEKGIVLVLLLWGLFSFPKGIGRSDLAHLAPAISPILIALLYIYQNSKQNTGKNSITNSSILVILAIMLTTSLYPLFDIFSAKIKGSYLVKAPNGSVPFSNESDANDFEGLIGYILENTEDDDYIFVTTWDSPPIYALTGRRNPTYYDSLNDLIIRSSEEKQNNLIYQLENNDVRYIIHNADWGYDNKPEQQFRTACSTLQKYIEKRWKPVAEFGYYTIYQRL